VPGTPTTHDSGGRIPPGLPDVLEEARARGLVGTTPLAEQVAHSLGFADAFEAQAGAAGTPVPDRPGERPEATAPPARWMDLGSGGGLPGLVLAGRWPSSTAVLLDAGERRVDFLVGAVADLGLQDRVTVVRARAEDAGRDPELRGGFDLVVARAFGPPPVTAECAAPFLRTGALLVVSEPPGDGPPGAGDGATGSPRWPEDGLAVLGLVPVGVFRTRFGYQVLRQARPCPDRFPRRPGIPAKRPLY